MLPLVGARDATSDQFPCHLSVKQRDRRALAGKSCGTGNDTFKPCVPPPLPPASKTFGLLWGYKGVSLAVPQGFSNAEGARGTMTLVVYEIPSRIFVSNTTEVSS